MAIMRLDKFLSHMGYGTRKEVKDLIKKGLVEIDGKPIKKPETKVTDDTTVYVEGIPLNYVQYEYYLLNKPQGCISATQDANYPTVMDFVFPIRNDCAPVERLDLDTEGALLITNDGKLSHKLLSAKHHVPKKYYVEVENKLPGDAKERFSQPMEFEEFTSLPATYQAIDDTHAYLTIVEGKYHQVKRMFERIGCPVTFLKRVEFGFLNLDGLPTGEVRELSSEEVEKLQSY